MGFNSVFKGLTTVLPRSPKLYIYLMVFWVFSTMFDRKFVSTTRRKVRLASSR